MTDTIRITWPESEAVNWLTVRACDEFGLGYRFVDTLPELAARSIGEGLDTPSLRILAGLSTDDPVEIRQYLEKILRELDIAYSKEGLALAALKHLTKLVLDGRVDPLIGNDHIIRIHDGEMQWSHEPLQKLRVLYDPYYTNEELLDQIRKETVDAIRVYRDTYLAGRINP